MKSFHLLPALLLPLTQASALEPLVPHVDHVRTSLISDKTYATFGYYNPNNLTLDIHYGASNYLSPAPWYRFQPLRFQYRDLGPQNEAFTVELNPGEWIEWRLFEFLDPELRPIGDINTPLGKDIPHTQIAYADTTMGSSFVDANSTFEWGSSARGVGELEVGTRESGSVFRITGGEFASDHTHVGVGGRMEVNSGTFHSDQTFRNEGTIHVNGGALRGSVFTNTASVHGSGGTLATNRLANTGSIEWTGGRLEVSDSIVNTGSIRLSGGTLAVKDFRTAGDAGFLWTGGTLEVATGDLPTTSSGFFGANPNLLPGQKLHLLSGTTQVGAGRYLNISPGAELVSQGGSNEGTIYVTAGRLSTEAAFFRNAPTGVISSTSSELHFAQGLENHGTLNLIDTTVSGNIHSPSGSKINVASGVTFTGHFHGAATFTGGGLATFQGGYSPGDSPALVHHAGSLSLTASNNLIMELGGSVRGHDYDALDVQGTIRFGGTLTLDLLAGFIAAEGAVFDLFDWGQTEGEFDAYVFPELDGGLAWDRSSLYQTGEIRIAAIPEPSTFLLGTLGILATLFRRRMSQ